MPSGSTGYGSRKSGAIEAALQACGTSKTSAHKLLPIVNLQRKKLALYRLYIMPDLAVYSRPKTAHEW
jgi:hypothetical protein